MEKEEYGVEENHWLDVLKFFINAHFWFDVPEHQTHVAQHQTKIGWLLTEFWYFAI